MVRMWKVGLQPWQKKQWKDFQLWRKIQLENLSWKLPRSWIQAFLAIWLLLGVVCSFLVIWSRKGSVERAKTIHMDSWCKQRSRILEEQVKANKNNAKTFSNLILVFGSTVNKTTFQTFSDSTHYAHSLLLGLMYAVFVDQSSRTTFETTNGIRIMDLSTGNVRSIQMDYLVIIYSNNEGQQFVNYDLMSVPDNQDAVARMLILDTGMMTVPYNAAQSGKIGIAVIYPVFQSMPNATTTPASNGSVIVGAVCSFLDFETLINKLLMQLDDPRTDRSLLVASPFVFELFDVTNIAQPIMVFGESIKLATGSQGAQGAPLAFAKYINFSKHDNPLEVDLGDPYRKYMVTCRYWKNQYGWTWGAVSWGLLLMAVVVLVFYIVWAAEKQMENLRLNYERMEALKTQAEIADKAKSEFLTTVSHEIRTPMNGVLGMLDFLLDTKLDSQQLEYTKIAQASGTTLISLINDVLDLAKAESGHMELEIREFKLRDTIEEVLDVFRARLRESGVEVAGIVDEDIPMILEGDPTRLRQVLLNLMGNALKFTASGHVLLRVCLYHENIMKVGRSGEGSSTDTGSRSNTASNSTGNSVLSTPNVIGMESINPSSGKTKPLGGSRPSRYSSTLRKARRSMERIRLSPNRQDSLVDHNTKVNPSYVDNGYDSLSGRQATDDRNSWSRIVEIRKLRSFGSSHSSFGDRIFAIAKSQNGMDLEQGAHKDEHPSSSTKSFDPEQRQELVKICIICEDTGVGIPPDALAKIFKPFVQAERSTTRVYGGTGIGLSISQQLVRLMGGTINFSTRVGVGTTFYFVISLGWPQKCNEVNKLDSRKFEDPTSSGLCGKRVILVDGIPLRRMVTEMALQRLGVVVISVSNPKALVDMMSVVLDLKEGSVYDKEGLEKLFEHWIDPCKKTSPRYQNPEVSETPRLVYRLTSNSEHSSSESLGVFGSPDHIGSGDGLSEVQTSYQSHITKNLQSLPSLKLHLSSADSMSSRPSPGEPIHNSPFMEKQFIDELKDGLKYDVMLVDKDAFGKCSGVEMGRYLSKSVKPLRNQLPPMVLLACKLEESEKDVQQLGFAGVLFKPIKPMVMVDLLSELLKVVNQPSPIVEEFAKASIRRDLKSLMNGFRVLVVDDNFVNRIVTTKMLQRYGVKVVIAESGKQAIDRLKLAANDIDIVFMDIQMPGMDGFETTTKIREMEATGEIIKDDRDDMRPLVGLQNKNRLLVMAMTADVFSTSSARIEAGGMDGFISKPIDEQQLYRALRGFCDPTLKPHGSASSSPIDMAPYGVEGFPRSRKSISLSDSSNTSSVASGPSELSNMKQLDTGNV